MNTVLFVDDEPQILKAIQLRLRRDKVWKKFFCTNSTHALNILENYQVDLLVCDQIMPLVNGIELLKTVKKLYPNVIRVLLTGNIESSYEWEVAHQLFNKPLNDGALEDLLHHTNELLHYSSNTKVRELINNISMLPSAPIVFSKLEKAIRQEASIGQITILFKQDPALIAKILQLVNSSFFGLSRQLVKIEQAIPYIGIKRLKSLVLSFEVFKDPSLDQLHHHSLLVAGIASALIPENKEDAFTVGLLHDIGKLVLVSTKASDFGDMHAELGAYLLGLWGLPMTVVDLVAKHHQTVNTRLGKALQLANLLSNRQIPNSELVNEFNLNNKKLSELVNEQRENLKSLLGVS